MKVPLEISFRNMSKDSGIEELIKNKINKLEKINDGIISCHTVIERNQKDIKGGNPFRVRISVRLPHSGEIVVTREPGGVENREKLEAIVRNSFEKLSRQLKSAAELRRRQVKAHTLQNGSDLML